MKKIAIIGASYLQLPLIEKAKKMGLETHVFAWKVGDVGEGVADFFYPISIVEKEQILAKCQNIGIDGICSIASDLAAITVNYVANKMGLTGNSMECVDKSTNKNSMRKCFEINGDPSPKSIMVQSAKDLTDVNLIYPVIVKPLDRSGSRGITKLQNENGLEEAIEYAKSQGFAKAALVEEFVSGKEYSVEYISWQGKHHFLALTLKFTTGSPHFIETGHLEPAPVDLEVLKNVKKVTEHALDSLGIKYGASHTEVKISDTGEIKIIEIGGRMGGDMIGSSLVELSTGIDFVGDVIRVALGQPPLIEKKTDKTAMVRFIMCQDDVDAFERIKSECPGIIVESSINDVIEGDVTNSSDRFGYYVMCTDEIKDIDMCLRNGD